MSFGTKPSHFNPLPRKEGDIPVEKYVAYEIISIHSLVKRETKHRFPDADLLIISIHSLVKRETQLKKVKLGANKFQSTPS